MAAYLCHEQPDLFVTDAAMLAQRPGAALLSRSAFYPGARGPSGAKAAPFSRPDLLQGYP